MIFNWTVVVGSVSSQKEVPGPDFSPKTHESKMIQTFIIILKYIFIHL